MVHRHKQWFPGRSATFRDPAIRKCRTGMRQEFVGRALKCLAANVTIVEKMIVGTYDG